jgi:hypothetical protein
VTDLDDIADRQHPGARASVSFTATKVPLAIEPEILFRDELKDDGRFRFIPGWHDSLALPRRCGVLASHG